MLFRRFSDMDVMGYSDGPDVFEAVMAMRAETVIAHRSVLAASALFDSRPAKLQL